ncbi:hypothetical protein [Roseibium aggregatum]|uniref:Uncharacterized protein n=1 Tax=Roseibium aggregatum TaxID=187304 RepID=A0A939EI25_9HYPH|nr:hypothetical protein [Roseibium aggregatum]MBN9673535.1 hypothetical protein [Roseibium aggregatum]
MVFHGIGMWLLVLSAPLWAYRWLAFLRLDAKGRRIFKHIVSHRHENPYGFALRAFAFLVAMAAGVTLFIFTLASLKTNSFEIGAFREYARRRLYSGNDPVDRFLDTFHYDQFLPIAILTTCALLAVAFTLVATALRDISIIRRLRGKLEGLRRRQAASG